MTPAKAQTWTVQSNKLFIYSAPLVGIRKRCPEARFLKVSEWVRTWKALAKSQTSSHRAIHILI